VQVLAGAVQGAAGAGERPSRAAEHGGDPPVQPDRRALETPFEPRVIASDGMEQQTVKGNTMTTVINPAKTISLTKCRPNTTRKEPTAVPKMTAPPSAKGLSCGGASVAGATVQKASLASPETKEQFRLQASLGRHQGWKSAVPANCCTPFGRGLPQFSFSSRLAATPGPIRNEPMR